MILNDAISTSEELPWDHWICGPVPARWEADTLIGVIDLDDTDLDADDQPIEFQAEGLKRWLTVSSFQDVFRNLREQVNSPTPQDCLTALEYYYEHDAFIAMAGSDNK